MGGNKRRRLLKRLKKESSKWKLCCCSLFNGKRFGFGFGLTLLARANSFLHDVVFHIVSAIEALVLVLTFCFFYLCFGTV